MDEQLVMIFERGRREIEREVARDGDRAAQMVVLMIARLAPLQVGDSLTVEEA